MNASCEGTPRPLMRTLHGSDHSFADIDRAVAAPMQEAAKATHRASDVAHMRPGISCGPVSQKCVDIGDLHRMPVLAGFGKIAVEHVDVSQLLVNRHIGITAVPGQPGSIVCKERGWSGLLRTRWPPVRGSKPEEVIDAVERPQSSSRQAERTRFETPPLRIPVYEAGRRARRSALPVRPARARHNRRETAECGSNRQSSFSHRAAAPYARCGKYLRRWARQGQLRRYGRHRLASFYLDRQNIAADGNEFRPHIVLATTASLRRQKAEGRRDVLQ